MTDLTDNISAEQIVIASSRTPAQEDWTTESGQTELREWIINLNQSWDKCWFPNLHWIYDNIFEVEDCEFVPVQWTLDSVHHPRMKFSLVDNWKCSGGWGLGVLIAGTQVRWTSNWGTITIYHPTQPPPYQNQQPQWHINTNKKLNFYMYTGFSELIPLSSLERKFIQLQTFLE